MKHAVPLTLLLASALSFGCAVDPVEQVEPTPASADAAPPDMGDDTPDAAVVVENAKLPTWMLRDIQPLSPNFDQTYGLDAFPEKTIVALLVAGF